MKAKNKQKEILTMPKRLYFKCENCNKNEAFIAKEFPLLGGAYLICKPCGKKPICNRCEVRPTRKVKSGLCSPCFGQVDDEDLESFGVKGIDYYLDKKTHEIIEID